jgi:hypothetical protein
MTGQAASPRVPTISQNLSPRNLSQHDFRNMETANMDVALAKIIVPNNIFQAQWYIQ